MTAFEDSAESLLEDAYTAQKRDGIDRLKAENAVIGDACEVVAELSNAGDITESQVNALADMLSDELARYTKTDIKSELTDHFVETAGDGLPFDEIIENRLDELKVVHSTDAKQGTVWRWHFSDGVKLETEVTKDGTRKHYSWQAFKRDYFDSLVSLGDGERIAAPAPDLRDPEEWQDWIDDLILEHSDPVEHVGPRTEAVRMLRDYVSRSLAYADMKDVRERQGIWVDVEDETGSAAADGGYNELRIPTEEIKRVCDQVGISTRALQVELEARGLVHEDTNGVSGHSYIDGVRVAYWSLTTAFADPEDIIHETETAAEQAQQEQEERLEEEQTDVGGSSDSSSDTEPTREGEQAIEPGESEEEDYTPGLRDGFGEDPDEVNEDE